MSYVKRLQSECKIWDYSFTVELSEIAAKAVRTPVLQIMTGYKLQLPKPIHGWGDVDQQWDNTMHVHTYMRQNRDRF